jgi:hypothetical protein
MSSMELACDMLPPSLLAKRSAAGPERGKKNGERARENERERECERGRRKDMQDAQNKTYDLMALQ